MPYLKAILVNATDKSNRMLRAKAMECISLVGMAVGKEKFRNDAKQVISFVTKPVMHHVPKSQIKGCSTYSCVQAACYCLLNFMENLCLLQPPYYFVPYCINHITITIICFCAFFPSGCLSKNKLYEYLAWYLSLICWFMQGYGSAYAIARISNGDR